MTQKPSALIAFNQHNQVASERTVELTRRAIAHLKTAGQKITLTAVSEATRAFDNSGKGLAPNTILRNLQARELFHEQSENFQRRQRHLGKLNHRRPRSRGISNVSAEYRGLRTSDLVQIIERLNQRVAKLQEQLSAFQAERDAAHRRCDELEQQNIRQLAELTNLKTATT